MGSPSITTVSTYSVLYLAEFHRFKTPSHIKDRLKTEPGLVRALCKEGWNASMVARMQRAEYECGESWNFRKQESPFVCPDWTFRPLVETSRYALQLRVTCD
jgi:hypothetical protein